MEPLPEVVAAQHHTYDVLANIMNVSLHCSQNYGALVGILQAKEETSEVEDQWTHKLSLKSEIRYVQLVWGHV